MGGPGMPRGNCMEQGVAATFFCCIRLGLAQHRAEVITGKEKRMDGFTECRLYSLHEWANKKLHEILHVGHVEEKLLIVHVALKSGAFPFCLNLNFGFGMHQGLQKLFEGGGGGADLSNGWGPGAGPPEMRGFFTSGFVSLFCLPVNTAVHS